MASRKRGGGGFVGTIVWAFLILSIVFAWFKTPVPADTSVMDFAKAKSNSVEAWVKNFTAEGFDISDFLKGSEGLPNFNGGINGGGDSPSGSGGTDGNNVPAPPLPQNPTNPSESLTALNSIPVADDEKVDYNRDEWNHWISSGQSCWDVREDVLFAEAAPGSTVLLDKSKNPTTDKAQACSITGGSWSDAYTGNTVTDPKKLDIDHMIPLSYAAKHGGQAWSKEKKQDYANNQSSASHLIAVDAGQNRAKGDKGPAKWKPKNEAYHCSYAKDWISISTTWGLSTTEADKKALGEMLGTCA